MLLAARHCIGSVVKYRGGEGMQCVCVCAWVGGGGGETVPMF